MAKKSAKPETTETKKAPAKKAPAKKEAENKPAVKKSKVLSEIDQLALDNYANQCKASKFMHGF